MIVFLYAIFLYFTVNSLNKSIVDGTNNPSQDDLPKLLLTILFYNKLLLSMQIIGAFVFFININPLNIYFILPNYKIIAYHFVILISLIIRDVKSNILGNISNHTNIIKFFMFLDTLRVLT
jgi:hypothetical protein